MPNAKLKTKLKQGMQVPETVTDKFCKVQEQPQLAEGVIQSSRRRGVENDTDGQVLRVSTKGVAEAWTQWEKGKQWENTDVQQGLRAASLGHHGR